MKINYNRLPILAEIIRSGSMSDAARLLGLTQSAISQQMSRFEEEVQSQLLERDGRNVRATEMGHRIGEAADLLSVIDGMVDRALEKNEGSDAECLDMFCFRSASLVVMPKALQVFGETLPNAQVAVREIGTYLQIKRTWEAGSCELGLVHEQTYFSAPFSGDAVRTVLLTEPMSVLMRSDHPMASCHEVTLEDLRNEFWVVDQGASIGYVSFARAAELAGFSPRVRCQSSALEIVPSLVAAGGGIALVPAVSGPPRAPGTVLVPLVYPEMNRMLVLLAPPGPKSKAARVMEHALVEAGQAIATKRRLS
jgi:DNA-binding transcriptional LysR family regulator